MPPRFDLVLCTGNAIMHLDPDELTTALRRSHAGLRPGGVLAFETRNPAAREWEQWTPEATYAERHTHVGLLREWLEVTDVTAGRVTFNAHNAFPDGDVRVYTSVLHFRDADTLGAALHDAGFEGVEICGGWSGENVTSSSRLLVVHAQRG